MLITANNLLSTLANTDKEKMVVIDKPNKREVVFVPKGKRISCGDWEVTTWDVQTFSDDLMRIVVEVGKEIKAPESFTVNDLMMAHKRWEMERTLILTDNKGWNLPVMLDMGAKIEDTFILGGEKPVKRWKIHKYNPAKDMYVTLKILV